MRLRKQAVRIASPSFLLCAVPTPLPAGRKTGINRFWSMAYPAGTKWLLTYFLRPLPNSSEWEPKRTSSIESLS